MTSIQIYYLVPQNLKKALERMDVDLDISVRQGNISLQELYKQIYNDKKFCREGESINYKHFLSLIYNDINLYAVLEEKVVGVLTFMFTEIEGEKSIIFDGICSPSNYSGLGIGQELINTLIRIGKNNDIKYIYLECRGNVMNYYHDKFGFQVIESKKSYDSDESDDEDNGELNYEMRLDLSTVSGGKKKRTSKKNTNKNNKRKGSRRTRRKLRK